MFADVKAFEAQLDALGFYIDEETFIHLIF
jgi:hypothetical protein